MDQPVALTGATGFAGGHVARELLQSGYRVRALVRRPGRLDAALAGQVEVVPGGLDEGAALDRLVAGAGAVIHCAGVISASSRNAYDEVNVAGTRALAGAGMRAGVKQFVLVSSLAARYRDLSPYAASKRAGEEAAEQVLAGKVALAIVRPPAVYGPGDRETFKLLRELTKHRARLPGHAGQRLSLIHVEDLARALCVLAGQRSGSAGLLEICDGKAGGYSWRDIGDAAAQVLGKDVQVSFLPRGLVALAAAGFAGLEKITGKVPLVRPSKVPELYHSNWVCDPAGNAQIKGWRPQTGFAEGLAGTLAWYVDNGWLPGTPPGAKSHAT